MLVTIKDSSVTAVIDSVGAQLISFKDASGLEYIWQRDPEFWSRSSPLLFPIVGNLRNDRTIIEGTAYEIPKHGFCRDIDFITTGQEETSVTFLTESTEETKQCYPYAFRLSLTYTLTDGSLSILYKVDNADDKAIHYCIGAHPGLCCPLTDDEAFEDYVLEFETEETASSITHDTILHQFDPNQRILQMDHTTRLPLTRELFRSDAVYFDSLKSKKVSLINPASGKGITVAYPDFETIAFWTPYPAQAPFVCIEPWNGSGVYSTEDDEFIHKNHLQTLQKGQSKTYLLSLTAFTQP